MSSVESVIVRNLEPMKVSINLLPPEPAKEVLKGKQRSVFLLTCAFLAAFLFINLAIFGLYWFLNFSTARTLQAIKREEETIVSLTPREHLYHALTDKISFLAAVWQKKVKSEQVVDFSQGLLVPGAMMNKFSLQNERSTSLAINAQDSDSLENFLNVVEERIDSGKIKNGKIMSTVRTEKGGYNTNIIFSFWGEK